MNGQPMPGQPMPGQPMPPMGQPQPQPQKSGLAIAGLIVGACGLFVCWIPILNVIGIIMGIVGLVLSIIGIVVTMQNKRTGKVLAIVGAVLSGLALILSIVVNVVVINAVNDALDDKTMSEIQEGLKDLDNKAKNKSDSDGATIMQGEGQLEDAYVKIAGVKGGLKDYDGDPAIMVTFEWTNTSDENAPFMTAIDASAFQDGHELETTTFAYNEQPSGYDSGSTIKDLQPNSKGTVTIAYKLENDKSPVTIECEDWFSIHSTDKVVQKFELQ
ncbi:hypothetical protein BIFGAL_04165 [Bifidobacterium gallicum DSM 20093 = LMG 11596]|nr:hypothetical protein BIFGAL_04165 [Bifidobacterium gallicum DSM 20093 = LMG 11596]